MNKTLRIIFHTIFILLLAAGICFGIYRYREYKKYEPLLADYERIATDDYTAVFFSTYPIDNFTEEDFEHYRAIYPMKASYCIPDLETLTEYFIRVQEAGNEVETVYLGIRPDIITADNLIELMSNWNDKYYEVIIAYPSLEYWQNLKDEEYADTLAAYENFIKELIPLYEENEWLQDYLSVYFYGTTQWLVGNPANYESAFGVNAGISHSLSMYTDHEHGFQLTLENYEDELDTFDELVKLSRAKSDIAKAKSGKSVSSSPNSKDAPSILPVELISDNEMTTYAVAEYPDLSKWDVVFFGDSVIAFSETSSIPGAFGGLTGAHTYNCGRGGSNATMVKEDSLGIPAIVDLFLAKDLSRFDENSQIYAGMSDYIKNAKKKRQQCFVISFGLNDYYSGLPVQNENDPNDIYTYAGAIRTAVDKLQAAYPDAIIALMTPNFTNYFGCGLEPQSENGGLLPDYVAAVVSISAQKGLPLYNSYTELGINLDNFTEYLLDGTHPNESTRFIMAAGLAKALAPYAQGGK